MNTLWVALALASTFPWEKTPVLAEPSAVYRAPAIPLVVHDPYFSVWSTSDRLTDEWSRHWTGTIQAMCGMARIDGTTYRFAGPAPDTAPAMQQVGVEVTPTRTRYRFEAGGVRLQLTFLTPALPENIDVLARPVTYVELEARAIDRRQHRVSLYLDTTAEWAVNTPEQAVTWDRHTLGDMTVLRVGTVEQPILAKKGDNLRIDWGWMLSATPTQAGVQSAIASDRAARQGFADTGRLPGEDDTHKPRAANQDWPVLAHAFDLGKLGATPVSRRILLAYDDIQSIELMGRRLRPYWRRTIADADALLKAAEEQHGALSRRSAAFDRSLTADLVKIGGDGYARLCVLAYRQCLAAHKIAVDDRGEPVMLSKENFSNGCMGTVDVLYPASPFFLLLNTRLLRAQLTPVLDYAASPRWKFPFAPHDLGTYPLANGQVYGGGEENEKDQMPVEESGNMLLMLAALAQIDGNADYAGGYWPVLSRWARFLRDKGLDPENQLCTDDFAGHLAHNANLSLKAILALGAYARLCERTGRGAEATEYRTTAEAMAKRWVAMADDGDHYRLTFDHPGTWSQKYNLVWDRLLGLKLFPDEVVRKETAYYLTAQNQYGLPLDNRSKYTKLDWTVWTATLAGNREAFDALIAPLGRFLTETPSRVPLSDWFWTHDARQVGFQARSVVGGVFIAMLADTPTWKRWAAKSR